jgi:predicted phosphodiesterase
VRRIALFSDVHGNLVALDTVLADIDRSGIDDVYCLGDLVGYGPDPAGVVERIRASRTPTIKGNYDEGIGERRGECGCYYATEQAKSDGAASYAFTDAALDDADHVWLAALPGEIRIEHEGVRILLAHGSPRKVNEYLLPDRQDAQLSRLADAAGADVVCVGHVHIPYHRVLDGEGDRRIHYVSAGSVGKPKDGDSRAGWAELVFGSPDDIRRIASEDDAAAPAGSSSTWLGIVFHRISYDVDSVVRKMAEVGLPSTLAAALRNG